MKKNFDVRYTSSLNLYSRQLNAYLGVENCSKEFPFSNPLHYKTSLHNLFSSLLGHEDQLWLKCARTLWNALLL